MKQEYSFNGQRENEEILEVINSHPYLMYHPGLKAMLCLLASVAILIFLPKFYIVSIVLFLIAGLYFLNAFYSYKESMTIITNQRIFCIIQIGFFKRKISEMELDQITDMVSETNGLIHAMLKYGDLVVRSASAKDSGGLVLKDIPNPYDVQQTIAKIKKENAR